MTENRSVLYKLLIVDDEPSMLEGLSRNVNWESIGFAPVALLDDGVTALDFLKKNAVDALLTDIRMPGASGVDLAEYIHASKLPTRVVLLSGYREFEDAQRAMRYGVRHYLTKPFLLKDLRETMRDVKEELDAAQTAQASAPPGGDQNLEPESGAALACRYIREHFNKKLTLTDVAKVVHLNPAYLSRVFSEQTGYNFRDYLTSTRIQAAARLLATTKLPVYTICDEVGYSDLKHFYRQFKQIMRVTPSEYRDLAGKESAQ